MKGLAWQNSRFWCQQVSIFFYVSLKSRNKSIKKDLPSASANEIKLALVKQRFKQSSFFLKQEFSNTQLTVSALRRSIRAQDTKTKRFHTLQNHFLFFSSYSRNKDNQQHTQSTKCTFYFQIEKDKDRKEKKFEN